MLKPRQASDAAIIEGVLSGHRNQFSLLVQKYLPTAYAVAYGRTGNHADAEDIAQDAFLHAFRGLDSLREREKFEGWLITIVRNAANKLWNQRKREGQRQPTAASSATPDMAQRELHAMLRKHIEQLDPDQRDILMLHYFAGKSTRELGQLLGISRDAAKKRLQRARETLSKDLLANLKEGIAPERSLQEQSKTITKTVLASVAAWELSKTGAAAVATTAVAALRCDARGCVLIGRQINTRAP